ncbi:MAG TPA: hypothetical protein VF832_00385 [Longimicrobiales bacterium]
MTATGELTASGRTILEVLVQPLAVEDIAQATGLPSFRTRAALREFLGAGLAEEEGGRFRATARGLERLQEPAR